MPRKNPTSLLILLSAFLVFHHLLSHAAARIRHVPADYSMLSSWVSHNINEFNKRRADAAHGIPPISLDHRLSEAEDSPTVITVSQTDPSARFRTITEAIEAVPEGNTRRTVVWIGGGEYCEKITVNGSKLFVTLYGDPEDMPTIVFNGTASKYGTIYSATVAVESNYFMAVNLAFVNSAPMPEPNTTGAQAVAMRISGDKAAFHNCRFLGFQDTLCDDRGRHFFKDCFIRGTVDFIFGNGKSLYLNTTIQSVAEQTGVITAQARENVTDDSGFTFIYCNITGIGNNTYLGRAWKERPRVVFAYTYMGSLINDAGWSTGKYPERNETVYYGEYKCTGPGASTSRRAKFAKLLSEEEAKPFLSMTYINGNKWLVPPPNFGYRNLTRPGT